MRGFWWSGRDWFLAGMSGVVDPLQSVEEKKLQEETLETEKAHSPPLLPDQTSVVLQWSIEQVSHWLRHSVPAEPDRLQGGFLQRPPLNV